QSLQVPIATPPLPPRLVLPLLQHIGPPLRPCVQVGEEVLKGQVIARGEHGIIAHLALHAPTSATIAAIGETPVPHPSGLPDQSITLIPDGEEDWHPDCRQGLTNPFEHDPEDLLERLAAAGIVGLGGAGFPTAIKLGASAQGTIDTLLINAAECEPYITADEALMSERATDIVMGIRILKHIVQPRHCVIATEDSKPGAVAAILAATAGTDIEPVIIPGRYPSGGEKQLIHIVTGKEVPRGGRPADIGILCANVGTAYATYRAIALGIPLLSRITTMTGTALDRPCNVEALIGTPADHLLQFCGLRENALYRLVVGGPMMGFTAHDVDVPIIKTSNCLIAATEQELPPLPPEQDCIRCGLCVQACPVGLLPQILLAASKESDHELALQQGLPDCIECGACSYVCPSHIPLVQYYRAEKGALRERGEKRKRATHWERRYEEHRQRESAREAEHQARRDRLVKAPVPASAAQVGYWLPPSEAVAEAIISKPTAPAGVLDPQLAKAEIEAAVRRVQERKRAQHPHDGEQKP
ncbi:MAG: electron transport complex subunit RsxC, partial [Pseudomonas sp.]